MENTLRYSTISRNSLVRGTLDCDHILNIFGKIYGNINSKKLILNNAIVYGDINVNEDIVIINSHVYGKISAKTVAFSGVCSGDIVASRLEFLDDMCLVYGNIYVDSWCVKPETKLRLKGKLAVTGIVRTFDWENERVALNEYVETQPKTVTERVKETVQEIATTIMHDDTIDYEVKPEPVVADVEKFEAMLEQEVMTELANALADSLTTDIEKTESNDPVLIEKKRYNLMSNIAIFLIIMITCVLLYLVSKGII